LAQKSENRHLFSRSGAVPDAENVGRMTMRDEMDARLWEAHHEAFADGIDELIARLRGGFARIMSWDGSMSHLTALLLSLVLTTVSLRATVI
jgi:hypothetical protein